METTLWIKRFYFKRTGIERVLLLSCAFSIFLWTMRFLVTGSLMHGFLIWNLFLAYIPYCIANYLRKTAEGIKNEIKFWFIFFCWLLFVPNSFYIVTDLFHLDEGTAAPQWYDLALIFSFAWNGLMFGVLSVLTMENLIGKKTRFKWVFVYAIMWLNAMGIYIGRYLRFNSWDIITNPFQLTADIVYLCFHPLRNKGEWAMIICFAILMTLIYKSLINLHKETSK